jgi:uncharacterized protein
MDVVQIAALGQFVLKIASRCNLDCSYCYMYNKGDDGWRKRPVIMSDDVFDAAIGRIREHCDASGQRQVQLSFHGGEPTLVGPEKFDEWCRAARSRLAHLDVCLSVQTNGVLLDRTWAAVFKRNRVDVGVSVDGTRATHDRYRVDHAGRGSYDRVVAGIGELTNNDVSCSALTVLPLDDDPVAVHQALTSLGCPSITYLLPDYTYDALEEIRTSHRTRTPAADFLIPIFDLWWRAGASRPMVRNLWNIGRLVLGGRSKTEEFGNSAAFYGFVDTDGSIQGLDVLRICEPGLHETGLNVAKDSFVTLLSGTSVAARAIVSPPELCGTCLACPEHDTCGGGYLPHRYSRLNGFDNPSVWCADILKLFRHARNRWGVSHDETARLRNALASA